VRAVAGRRGHQGHGEQGVRVRTVAAASCPAWSWQRPAADGPGCTEQFGSGWVEAGSVGAELVYQAGLRKEEGKENAGAKGSAQTDTRTKRN
jgi:hypothetical protein